MSDSEWVKSLRHRWMFVKTAGLTGPFYHRCIRCGGWKVAVMWRLPFPNSTGLARQKTHYGAGLAGPWKTRAEWFPCEGLESPSLFPNWFSGVGLVEAQNRLMKMGVVPFAPLKGK